MRVLLRLLRRAQKWVPMSPPSHHRRVRRRTTALRAEKLSEEERAALYFDLLQDTERYVEAALVAAEFLDGVQDPGALLLGVHLRAQAENALCIVDQTERRILEGQQVPATGEPGQSARADLYLNSQTRRAEQPGLDPAAQRSAQRLRRQRRTSPQ